MISTWSLKMYWLGLEVLENPWIFFFDTSMNPVPICGAVNLRFKAVQSKYIALHPRGKFSQVCTESALLHAFFLQFCVGAWFWLDGFDVTSHLVMWHRHSLLVISFLRTKNNSRPLLQCTVWYSTAVAISYQKFNRLKLLLSFQIGHSAHSMSGTGFIVEHVFWQLKRRKKGATSPALAQSNAVLLHKTLQTEKIVQACLEHWTREVDGTFDTDGPVFRQS